MRTLSLIPVSLVVVHNLRTSFASLRILFSYVIFGQNEKLISKDCSAVTKSLVLPIQ
jgi:hypothetical protein